MFGFGSLVHERECGVIVDIGSGSVGAALIVSEPDQKKPIFVWSNREYVLLGSNEAGEVTLRHIHTALINIFLTLGGQGIKQLHRYDTELKPTHMQMTISAPWSHTGIKRVQYTDEHPFTVTPELLQELSDTAKKHTTETILKNTLLKENGTVALDNKPIGIITNGYNVPYTTNAHTRNLSLIYLSALAQKRTIEIVEDSKNKLFPKTALFTHSFMYIYYKVLKQSAPDITEACLIDVTSEATEIGIIREGMLTHVTHIPYGTYTLTRDIAAACTIPKEEAYTYLKGEQHFIDTKLSDIKKEDVTSILTAYEERLAKLFKSTGDALAIPKSIFIHTDPHTEFFFKKHIAEASRIATNIDHTMHLVTESFLASEHAHDTGLELSGMYFHQQHCATLKKNG